MATHGKIATFNSTVESISMPKTSLIRARNVRIYLPPPNSHALAVDTEPTPDTYNLFTVTNGDKSLMVKVQVNKQEILMEIDTEVSLTIISEDTLNIFSSGLDLKPTDVSLRVYTGCMKLSPLLEC